MEGAVNTISFESREPLTVNCWTFGSAEADPKQATIVPVTDDTKIEGPATQLKLQARGREKPTGTGGVKVLSVFQFAALLMAGISTEGILLVVEQLYFALIPELMAVLFADDKAAGRIEELEEKKQFTRLASQALFKLMPAISVGVACKPWYAKI